MPETGKNGFFRLPVHRGNISAASRDGAKNTAPLHGGADGIPTQRVTAIKLSLGVAKLQLGTAAVGGVSADLEVSTSQEGSP